MRLSRILTAAAALPFLLAPAFAQQAATEFRELDDDAMTVEPFALTVDEIEDMNVHGEGGDQIGEVEEVLTDASGQIVGLAVETEGFLGIVGDEDVVVSLDQLELVEDRFVTALTEDELEALPRWDD